jgi:hypothetical protein
MRQFGRQQVALRALEERQDGRHGFLPPRQAAQIRLIARVIASRQVHACQHLSDFDAVFDLRRHLRRAFEFGHDGCGLAMQCAEQRAIFARHGVRHRHAVRGQMPHQIEIERQLPGRQLLENGEDVFAARRRQKEVAVLNTGRDAAKLDDFAEIVVTHPFC